MLLHTDGLHWTILCPGPSLWEMDAIDAPGPVVAVNVAIEHPTLADYWCVNDPIRVFKSIIGDMTWEECNEFPIVWSLRQDGWSAKGFRVHPTGGGQWFHRKMPHAYRGACYINITMASALGRVLMHNPSKIDIYGCDMEGFDYGKKKDWLPIYRDEYRWRVERKQIHRIADAFSETEINFRKELVSG